MTWDDVLTQIRLAGLDLPAEFHGELAHANERLQAMLDRMPVRHRSDEPGHVFDPQRFMPPPA